MWCARRREAESLITWEKMSECRAGYSRRQGWSRALLRWHFSGKGAAHSGITRNTHYPKAEEAFSLVSLIAQLKSTTEFQSVNNFSSSARTVSGSQVTWGEGRDWRDNSSKNVAPLLAVAGFRVKYLLLIYENLICCRWYILPVYFYNAEKKKVTINSYSTYCWKGVFWRADTYALVPTGWTVGLICTF